jgi:hypothetical protein
VNGMTGMPYTVRDTPAIVARVEEDLSLVRQALRTTDPGLRALVLTGAFARGEGAFLGGRPRNDYDLVALRGWRRPRVGYAALRDALTARLGVHVDLAPVWAGRLRWSPRSLFWYETARCGRTLWGPDLLACIPVRQPSDIDAGEALRLLVNRAAGLLLHCEAEPDEVRLQAAKAILAASDSLLLAHGGGVFPPTQRARHAAWLARRPDMPPALAQAWPWVEWALALKLDPERAPEREAGQAWRAARAAILGAVPATLAHAGLDSLEAYGRRDRWVERAVYVRRAAGAPGLRPWLAHPTGRIRMATLRLLEASPDGHVAAREARHILSPLARWRGDPLQLLGRLRAASVQ